MTNLTITLTEIVDGVSVESSPQSVTVYDGVFVNTGGGGGGGAVNSVNGKTGTVVLSAADVSAVPTSRTVNGKALSADITLTASDVGAGTSNFDGAYTSLTGKPTLGTAAAKDIPATGNASSTQVVYGNDTRLTDSRTPTTHTHAEADVTNLTTDLAAKLAKASNLSDVASASTSRTNLGLGTSATVDVPASGNASTSQVVKGNDTRLTDSRTPTAHASTHASAGSDPISIAESQVTNLTTDLAGKVPTTRTITAGTGLTGGGDLSADRTLTVAYGTSSTTAAVGNDSRLSDARTPTAHASSHASGGSDAVALDASQVTRTTNAQTGTTYTLVLGDATKFVSLSNASAVTLTVPPNSSVAFPTGTEIILAQLGAGQVTIAPGSGVTLNSTPGLKIAAQYGTAALKKTATDTWLVFGRLSA